MSTTKLTSSVAFLRACARHLKSSTGMMTGRRATFANEAAQNVFHVLLLIRVLSTRGFTIPLAVKNAAWRGALPTRGLPTPEKKVLKPLWEYMDLTTWERDWRVLLSYNLVFTVSAGCDTMTLATPAMKPERQKGINLVPCSVRISNSSSIN